MPSVSIVLRRAAEEGAMKYLRSGMILSKFLRPFSRKNGIVLILCSVLLLLLAGNEARTAGKWEGGWERGNSRKAPVPVFQKGETLTGRVIRVADGDTVTLLTPEKQEIRIRFQGIDAPEREQDFGAQSRKNLNSFVYGKKIRVKVDKTDKHGRVVGRVWLPQGKGAMLDVEEAQLRAGMAWHYEYFNHEKKLANAQKEAQRAKRGIWSRPNPVPPWDWRQKKWKEKR